MRPSCNPCPMVEVGAHLNDHVLPPLTIRQWVVSVPKRIRPFFPHDPARAGGAGTDSCYAPQEVGVTGCEQLEAIGDPLLRMIETTFGTALADVWRQ